MGLGAIGNSRFFGKSDFIGVFEGFLKEPLADWGEIDVLERAELVKNLTPTPAKHVSDCFARPNDRNIARNDSEFHGL